MSDALKKQVEQLQETVQNLEQKCLYYQNSISELFRAVRHLQDHTGTREHIQQTKDSFDFQWDQIPNGKFLLSDTEFKPQIPQTLMDYTQLDTHWFKDKSVLDVGCGQGRFSWGFAELGAQVLGIDQSQAAIASAQKNCPQSNTRFAVHDLLKDKLPHQFDLTFCYGVLHHTGHTHQSFQKVASTVKKDGYLFLMLYGEPRFDYPKDYQDVNRYAHWRDELAGLDFAQKAERIRKALEDKTLGHDDPELLHGFFDALSPQINDKYRLSEIREWLIKAGFTNIKLTQNRRHHHLIAQKTKSP